MAGYDPKKAATYNQLRQQGLSEDAAATQAGITGADSASYVIGDNGQMGPDIQGASKVAGRDYDTYTAAEIAESRKFDKGLQSDKNFENVPWAEDAKSTPGTVKPINYTTTSTETVSGGGTQSVVAGPRVPNNESRAYASAYEAKQAEYNQFIKDNPSDSLRKKQGLPPMTPEEKAAYEEKRSALSKEKSDLKQKQIDAETAGPPTETNTPNTTTTTTTVTTGTSATNQPVNEQSDQQVFNQTETQLGSTVPTAPTDQPQAVSAETDPFEQARLQAAAEEGPTALNPEDVDPMSDEEVAQQEERQAQNREVLAEQATDVEPGEDPFEAARQEAENAYNAEGPTDTDLNVDPYSDPALYDYGTGDPQISTASDGVGVGGDIGGAFEAATIAKAKEQATLAARYKSPANADWRVRLVLAEGSDYLYKASPPGILAPLAQSNGVIFPYTPQIQTSYSANYEQYDLVHSNYRGYFYKNSKVGDIQVNGVFTAQDTQEAEYLLAVIHFFRSATKMFYGKDAQRGTPPPLVYLIGYGDFQFNGHPCLISNFQYSLPSDVDYIRAKNPNNYGTNMNRVSKSTVGLTPAIASINRLANAIDNFGRSLQVGALPAIPSPGDAIGTVNNLNRSTYVPTKMEINITLLPLQTRAQVSKQFSLKGFANGDLLKGGFW